MRSHRDVESIGHGVNSSGRNGAELAIGIIAESPPDEPAHSESLDSFRPSMLAEIPSTD